MTKRLFVCYALERNKIRELQDRVARITHGARAAGYEAYVHARDAQQWNVSGSDLRQVLDVVFRTIRESDAVLMDLTIETPGYKRVGLNIECGFAKALDKPIAALWREPDRPAMTTDLADEELAYHHLSELQHATTALLMRLQTPSPIARSQSVDPDAHSASRRPDPASGTISSESSAAALRAFTGVRSPVAAFNDGYSNRLVSAPMQMDTGSDEGPESPDVSATTTSRPRSSGS